MTKPSKQLIVDGGDTRLDYKTLNGVVRRMAGFIRSSGLEGNTAEVWDEHTDTVYIFEQRGMEDFLFAVKDWQMEKIYGAKDFAEYALRAAEAEPSEFVSAAIKAKAQSFLDSLNPQGDS